MLAAVAGVLAGPGEPAGRLSTEAGWSDVLAGCRRRRARTARTYASRSLGPKAPRSSRRLPTGPVWDRLASIPGAVIELRYRSAGGRLGRRDPEALAEVVHGPDGPVALDPLLGIGRFAGSAVVAHRLDARHYDAADRVRPTEFDAREASFRVEREVLEQQRRRLRRPAVDAGDPDEALVGVERAPRHGHEAGVSLFTKRRCGVMSLMANA